VSLPPGASFTLGACSIVDVDARLIERWRPGDDRPEILSETIEWQPAGAHMPLAIELREFFQRALE